MRLFYYCLLASLTLSISSCAQSNAIKLKYLGQHPPSSEPQIFAPGQISKSNESEFGSVFNKDGTAFYYGVDKDGLTEIRFSELLDNKWSTPSTILSNDLYGFNDPFLSPDEKRLYFISEQTLDGLDAKRDHDIWYVEKAGKNWSKPINAGPNINTKSNEYYISFTESGTMYFSSNKTTTAEGKSNFDIYSSAYINDTFQEATALGASVNTEYYEADVFVDPAEEYLIFCGQRPGGLGRGDLYISFKNPDGTWAQSISMGSVINTKNHELCPFVTKDGKYLFYTSNQDIYWVSTVIIETLKNTN